MHHLVVASLAAAGLSFGLTAAASAADLGSPARAPVYTKAPVMAPYYNWNGFYIGGNVGYSWEDVKTDTFSLLTGAFEDHTTSTRRGVLGGGQLGYNYLVAPNWLLGVETDLDAADITGSSDNCRAVNRCAHGDAKTDMFGTVRGRAGYVANNWLLYATGGFAYAHSSNTGTITAAPVVVLVGQAATASGTEGGWTAGGGIEWGFAPNWSAKAEYLFARIDVSRDFNYIPATASSHHSSTDDYNIARAGINYHFWSAR
jgi:outer membrane immunogenic protein